MQCDIPKAGILFFGTTNKVYMLNMLEMMCSMGLFR